jgi:hypothetical protein
MRIREYTPTDFDALRRMHAAQGFGYPLPDLDSPLFISKLVLEDDDEDEEDDDDDAEDPPEEMKSASSGAGFSLRVFSESREAPPENSQANNFPAHARAKSPRAARTPKQSGIAMAFLLRLTAETYLLHDPAEGTPRRRWQRFLALHEAARASAAGRGLDDVQAFLPPRVARAFGRRLSRLGWTRDPWPCFSKQV